MSTTRVHHRLRRSGRRAARLDAAQAARYRDTLAATADLAVPVPRPEHARNARHTRRAVRQVLRHTHLIGEVA